MTWLDEPSWEKDLRTFTLSPTCINEYSADSTEFKRSVRIKWGLSPGYRMTEVQTSRKESSQSGNKMLYLPASSTKARSQVEVWVGKGYGDPQTTFAHIDASEIQEGLWEILAPSITCGCPEDARA